MSIQGIALGERDKPSPGDHHQSGTRAQLSDITIYYKPIQVSGFRHLTTILVLEGKFMPEGEQHQKMTESLLSPRKGSAKSTYRIKQRALSF